MSLKSKIYLNYLMNFLIVLKYYVNYQLYIIFLYQNHFKTFISVFIIKFIFIIIIINSLIIIIIILG